MPPPVCAFVSCYRFALQVFGVLVCILRVFSDLHHLRHAGLAEEGRAGSEKTDCGGG